MTEREKLTEKELPDQEPLAWHPILFAAVPVLAAFSSNIWLFQLHDLLRPFFCALMIGAIFWGLGSFAFGDQSKGAAAALAGLACLWGFSLFNRVAAGYLGSQAALWTGLILALGAAYLAGRFAPKPQFFNTATLILTLLIVGRTGFSLAFPPRSGAESTAQNITPLPPGPRPDIFFIIADGFGRLDVLKDKHKIDLAWFESALKQRGFSLVAKSRSSYIQTQLSLSSTLNMNQLSELVKDDKAVKEKRIFQNLMQNSQAAAILAASGYDHVSIGSGFNGVRFGGRVLPLAKSADVTLFEGDLLQKTPFSLMPWLDKSQRNRHRTFLKGALSQTADQSGSPDKPIFAAVHLLTPHPPFVFKPDGSHYDPKEKFAVSDADDYMERVAGPDDYRRGYGSSVQFTAHALIKTIDAVMANHKGRPPIIIIQGDHGPKLGVSHKSLAKTDIAEGFPNLYAYFTPKEIPFKVPDGDASVNTFRRLFTAMGAKGLEALPAKSFYSTSEKPLDLTDVTDQVP